MLGWGVIAGIANRKEKNPNSGEALRNGTQSLIASLQKENDAMEVDKGPSDFTVAGLPALSTYLHNDSPAGGTETDWLVTVIGPQGLYYYVFVSPESDFPRFKPAFENIVNSVQFQTK